MNLPDLEKLAAAPSSVWGVVELPPEMRGPPSKDSSQFARWEAAWSLIQPLIEQFEHEHTLSNAFKRSIDQRAKATQTSYQTLLRLVLRYYYFGQTRFGLLPLTSGTSRGQNTYPLTADGDTPPPQPKRRGRQIILSDELGKNDFVVSQDDIDDMVSTLRSALKNGPTYCTHAYETYLGKAFRRRHPDIYEKYSTGRHPEPVTLRQFRYYTDKHAVLDDDLSRNLRTVQRNSGFLGGLQAAGPGELYEIDSTGGRLYLVSQTDPPVIIGKPNIYFIIDRWSRFIVSAYLSLRPPSYEEVRHALLIAFTSRTNRFAALGVDVDDNRWPVGRVCAVLCPDRGADFMSSSMEQAVVQDLRIELTPLPPLCPDGKAIVERLMREFKRRMAASGFRGAYADRPLDPPTKNAASSARAVAIHSLAEAYRPLIEFVCDHNKRPHKSLRRNKTLVQAGVRPVPEEAYLWGLKNLTGLRRAPLADADYQRLLLASDTASIANRVLRYKDRVYQPVNESAAFIANRSTGRPRQVEIRLDKTEPFEIYVPDRQNEWARFQITRGGEAELFGLTLEEEQALTMQESRLWARSDHESRLQRVSKKNEKIGKKATEHPIAPIGRQQQEALRARESSEVKLQLTGRVVRDGAPTKTSDPPPDDWKAIEASERLKNLDAVRKLRSKR
ncbi:hypothetical protein ACNRBS_01335 [Ralstonia pseudosolanacearum]|uniref:hypothetical protein n=1 Tax=Ralstonia pseudosolanacearum TaxID=1310165 RepID=UPI003AAE0E09